MTPRRARSCGVDVQESKKGSHKLYRVGGRTTTIPHHTGEDIGTGEDRPGPTRRVRQGMDPMSYRASIERDDEGWWVADVPDLPGCHTQGRTLTQLRRRLRDVLTLFTDDADAVTLVEEVRLPDAVSETLTRAEGLRESADAQAREAGELTRSVVVSLRDGGLTMRQIAEVVGLSHQRVAQLLHHVATAQKPT